ncbi:MULTISPECIES: hypothetical protein [Bradyrhizobium]|uniref:hypothetical protein n=1 Tax=Bradyrhizobium elkanii TaxID=29448 RepID=UPI0004821996|nr:hypothetical protein [Bradyrhizobium elkanii]
MIDLARHVSLILKQIRFVARHAVSGTRSEDSQSIAAMRQIVAEFRRSASAIEIEAKRREESARDRAVRNAILMRDREQPGDRP